MLQAIETRKPISNGQFVCLPVRMAVEEILHVGARRGIGLAQHFDAVRPVHFLRQVADLLASRDGAVGPEHVFGDAELVVAEAGIPGEQQRLMLHDDVHRVRHFAAVLPAVEAAGHGDCVGNIEAHHLVPERELLGHVLVHVAAGVVVEEPPVDVTVGVEIARRRSAQKCRSSRWFRASCRDRRDASTVACRAACCDTCWRGWR